ncbi:MAG: chromosome segregation protein SMC [Cyanobacteria bacterium P01_H01_bin.121]
MVHVKRVELCHFKSFGGTTDVPLLEGFTVVTGPNGSGKSNILDGLLFALGLSTSKGMRADRLPDLVNTSHASRSRSTVETTVSATFALDGWEPDALDTKDYGDSPTAIGTHLSEWIVTRRLRVTPQGTYTSTYYINSQPCTLTELHEQLYRLRIYPEGYNIVLQGDVTGIISMNARERRGIIDEMAGVAQFDRKIAQAKDKLDGVKEREDRCRIIEKELTEQRDRLAQDRQKAEKYQRLRAELQEKERWEQVLIWQGLQQQLEKLERAIQKGEAEKVKLATAITDITATIQATTTQLDQLNCQVKALGEDELLQLQSQMATHEAELRQLQRQQQNLETAGQTLIEQLQATQQALEEQQQAVNQQRSQQQVLETEVLVERRRSRDDARQALDQSRQSANAIASESQVWAQQQSRLRQQIDLLNQVLEPQRAQRAQLDGRTEQLSQRIQEQTQATGQLTAEIEQHQELVSEGQQTCQQLQTQVAELAQQLASAEQELNLQRETHSRLLKEQRDKQRQLDRQDSMRQALQETQGTQATQLILQSDLTGVHGLVAHLGQVEARYQLALDIAVGGRLGYLVVADDQVAAAGIELLKQRRAGRATFLPLTKIRPSRHKSIPAWQRPEGMIDYAVNLVECDDRYDDIFSYLLGGTVVFDSLEKARRQLGQYRIVTLAGELLEASGAMTGGSLNRRPGSLSFSQGESSDGNESNELSQRLQEIEQILGHCERKIQTVADQVRQRTQTLAEARQNLKAAQLETEQLQKTLDRLQQQQTQIQTNLQQNTTALTDAEQQQQKLNREIPEQETQLNTLREQLSELEKSPLHADWQARQQVVQGHETALQDAELALREVEQQLQTIALQQQRGLEKIEAAQLQIQQLRQQQTRQINEKTELSQQQTTLQTQIEQQRQQFQTLEQKLGADKQERDRVERLLREQQGHKQELEWQQQKLQETQQERQGQRTALQQELQAKQTELPEPLPEIPEAVSKEGVGVLQHQLRSLARRIQAMEPVNMLALEEYERTETRLQELSEKLATLESERTELLLRVENFTTLRQQAFMESFNAVNTNFKEIFEQLSDGEGYLELDQPDDPLNGGLNLVAHPKGKPVRRLASMSGGEKSLTALSFIFALQRYRPSPFYAFDEVDSFLDGANVERLARIIKQQSHQAQFIVVSHRRPMIEASERTIGVTQARGAHTQVLGIALEPQTVSS